MSTVKEIRKYQNMRSKLTLFLHLNVVVLIDNLQPIVFLIQLTIKLKDEQMKAKGDKRRLTLELYSSCVGLISLGVR